MDSTRASAKSVHTPQRPPFFHLRAPRPRLSFWKTQALKLKILDETVRVLVITWGERFHSVDGSEMSTRVPVPRSA
eukprot:3359977-Rhodomonas_salina.1